MYFSLQVTKKQERKVSLVDRLDVEKLNRQVREIANVNANANVTSRGGNRSRGPTPPYIGNVNVQGGGSSPPADAGDSSDGVVEQQQQQQRAGRKPASPEPVRAQGAAAAVVNGHGHGHGYGHSSRRSSGSGSGGASPLRLVNGGAVSVSVSGSL